MDVDSLDEDDGEITSSMSFMSQRHRIFKLNIKKRLMLKQEGLIEDIHHSK